MCVCVCATKESVCRQITGLGGGSWGRMSKGNSKEAPFLTVTRTEAEGAVTLLEEGALEGLAPVTKCSAFCE